MHDRTRPWIRGFGATLAACCFMGCLTVLAVRMVPGSWGEAEHAGRFAYAIAFFVRTFEPHGAAALLVNAAMLLIMRRWWSASAAVVVSACILGPVAWTFVRPEPPAVRTPLTVLTANLLVGHGSVERVVRLIEQEAPDVIFFQEYTPLKAAKLIERIGASYPHRVEGLRDHAFGAAIYSRTPFVGEPELYPHESIRAHPAARSSGEVGIWDPQPRAVIRHDGHEVVLQNVHFAPPIHVAYLREQRVMTGWLCRWLGSERRAMVIAGDLNCTDSSVNLGDLRATGLASVREAGRGWMGTWPSSGLAGLVPVGIDHILIRGLRCDRARVGEAIDSDHLPLIARVGVE